jgi:hypothetical protein
MTARELHLELLLGKQVLDLNDRPIGHLEEVVAEQQGEDWVITAYLIGPIALIERLSAWTLGLALLRMLGAQKWHQGYRIPWDRLDLSDLDHLRLTCTAQELATLQPPPDS